MSNLSVGELDDIYSAAIEEVNKLDSKKDRMEKYCLIRMLLQRLSVDIQTWRSMLNDWSLMSKFSDEEFEPIFDMFKELTISEVQGMQKAMQSEPVKNAYEIAMNMMKKMDPQARPIPERMVYVDRSNSNKEDKREEK